MIAIIFTHFGLFVLGNGSRGSVTLCVQDTFYTTYLFFLFEKWHVQYVIELSVYFCVERLERILTILCVHVFLYSRVTYTCFCVHKRGKILSYSNGNHQTPFCMRLTLPYLAFC